MADKSYIHSLLSAVPDATTKALLLRAFDYVLDNISLGTPEHQTRATNMQAYYELSTTATSTGEFSITHGLPDAPTYAIPVLKLNQAGAAIVNVQVSRVADSKRFYLKTVAGSTNVPVAFLVG